jgi:hypothetical protein
MAKVLDYVKPQALERQESQPLMLLSDTRLRQIMGGLWLLDGLLQMQPQMFTMTMINTVMQPTVAGQPALVATTLRWIIALTTHYLVPINWAISIVQVGIGLWLLSGRRIKEIILLSTIWSVVVWYAGEGMSMLLTGQASTLTGAPGSVLLYPLLSFAFYPLRKSDGTHRNLLSRHTLRVILGWFWVFAALLQLQPYWWQAGQISQQIAALYSPGTLAGRLLDPSLHSFSSLTSGIEVSLNLLLIGVFLNMGLGLLFAKGPRVHSWLMTSLIVSVVLWWCCQALGMVLTGLATDFNSGPLLVVLALACWPTIE